MADDPLANMRARIAQCRKLAEMIHNPTARQALLQMAEEGEADLKKLEAERGERGS
jgi:hypothetical protein